VSREAKVPLVEPLTERERQVLGLLAQGKSNRELADELVLSLHTVKWHNRQIYGKLGVTNREEAVTQAWALGLVAGDAQPSPSHNLPLQLSSFVGREWELAETRRLLSTSRLVTLTGAAGCGKTRLALQLAATVCDTYPDGVWLGELAPLSDPALVPQVVATLFAVREVKGRPLLTLLLSYLCQRQLLLVVDNCEHLVEAVAQLVCALLGHCPHLRILVTSREPLAVAGEVTWHVPPLSLPDPEQRLSPVALLRSDAIRLFVERATGVLPSFRLTAENAGAVAEVCHHLDGIPLAIELAAARTNLLRVEQIAGRLDDRFHLLAGGSRTALPRHQTLKASLDWSYDLLSEVEQHMLRQLSVFAGGFTLEAAGSVCTDPDAGDMLQLLAQLVAKSLVVTNREPGAEARFHLLESIRHYALEKLVVAGDVELARACHLAYFLQLAETAESQLASASWLAWLDRIGADYDNFRAALGYSLAGENAALDSGLRLATALVPYWIICFRFGEARRWLDLALARRHEVAAPARARFLLNAGWLLNEQWEVDPSALLQEALDIYCRMGDKAGIAWSMLRLGVCAWKFELDLDKASSLCDESLCLAQALDEKLLLSWLFLVKAWVAMARGEGPASDQLAAQGLALVHETGSLWMERHLLFVAGRNARLQQDYRRATAFLHQTLVLDRVFQDRYDESITLNALGEMARAQQAYGRAAAYYRQCLAIRRQYDDQVGIAETLHNLALVALEQRDYRHARDLLAESMATGGGRVDRQKMLFNVWALARIVLAGGEVERATRLFAAAAPMLTTLAYGADSVDLASFQHDVACLRAQLGEQAFAAAWAEGEAMSLEEAVALALATTESAT
jgi:predicted ATPase/DNA-binding CsgD family transcriptional regulator